MYVHNTKYYADQVAAHYPKLGRGQVNALCSYVMRQVFGLLAQGHEVKLCNNTAVLKIYRRDFNAARANEANFFKRRDVQAPRQERALRKRIRKVNRQFKDDHLLLTCEPPAAPTPES